ncbi:MAG: potassium channel family protein [Deltaproteobacteria bacterium]|nr:potassium channel family protein [Deltaproteobacteria bacterium]
MAEVRFRLIFFAALIAGVVALGLVLFPWLEGLSVADALYFSLVTIATVGYGDIHPYTPAGKALAMVLIVAGTGSFMGLLAAATEMFLNRRDQRSRRAKLNVVEGLFFQEVGNRLLTLCVACDPDPRSLAADLQLEQRWSEKELAQARRRVAAYAYPTDVRLGSPQELREFLRAKGDFLVRLLENPHLVEQESLTELLLAVMHLREELLHRPSLRDLPASDYTHLSGDLKRVYRRLVHNWLEHAGHLLEFYPYLFAMVVRLNPFNPAADVVVRG